MRLFDFYKNTITTISTSYNLNSMYAGDAIDVQGIFLLLHNVSSSSPLMLLLLPHVMSPDMPYIQQKVVIGLF